MAMHNELGKKGEALAAAFLQKKGYRVLARNFRYKKWEIDLVVKDGEQLVIVEVKTRQNDFMADPLQLVGKGKQRILVKAANHYINQYALDCETRFDIVSILTNGNRQHIKHIEDAFYPVL